MLIRKAEIRGDLHGISICHNAPVVSNLLFADNCFLFVKATDSESLVMKTILTMYGAAASGQAISLP
jgi:hypothetical protein